MVKGKGHTVDAYQSVASVSLA